MTLTYEEQRTNAEKIADEKVRGRVLRGIELLRREYGPSWPDHIDVVLLDLRDIKMCVLGQLESERSGGSDYYGSALARIDGELEEAPEAFGFNSESFEEPYHELTAAWRLVLGSE